MNVVSPLVRYEAMLSAIAECERVDEAKDIRDKAIALEAYYRQALNHEAERLAVNIRLRAERRVGELLKELARVDRAEAGAMGGHAKAGTSTEETRQPSPYAETLTETGMSRQQAHRFQRLANVPQEEFEAALAAAEKPTTAGIAMRVKVMDDPAPPQIDRQALWLWGRLRDFEQKGFLEIDPAGMVEKMPPTGRAEVLRLAPQVARFLRSIGRAK